MIKMKLVEDQNQVSIFSIFFSVKFTPKWAKTGKNGQKWGEMGRNGPNMKFLGFYFRASVVVEFYSGVVGD